VQHYATYYGYDDAQQEVDNGFVVENAADVAVDNRDDGLADAAPQQVQT
jgi:hypothetical protein